VVLETEPTDSGNQFRFDYQTAFKVYGDALLHDRRPRGLATSKLVSFAVNCVAGPGTVEAFTSERLGEFLVAVAAKVLAFNFNIGDPFSKFPLEGRLRDRKDVHRIGDVPKNTVSRSYGYVI
jgi:hypothetical protein